MREVGVVGSPTLMGALLGVTESSGFVGGLLASRKLAYSRVGF